MRIFFFQVLHASPKFPLAYPASWCLLPPTWPHLDLLDLLGHHINFNDDNDDPMATMTITFTSSHHHSTATTNAAKQRWPLWPSPHHIATGMELPPPTMALQPLTTNATTFTLHVVITRSPWHCLHCEALQPPITNDNDYGHLHLTTSPWYHHHQQQPYGHQCCHKHKMDHHHHPHTTTCQNDYHIHHHDASKCDHHNYQHSASIFSFIGTFFFFFFFFFLPFFY